MHQAAVQKHIGDSLPDVPLRQDFFWIKGEKALKVRFYQYHLKEKDDHIGDHDLVDYAVSEHMREGASSVLILHIYPCFLPFLTYMDNNLKGRCGQA